MDGLLDELEFEFSLKPDSDPELGHYVIRFQGYATRWDEAAAEERRVGMIRGTRLDLAAAAVDGLPQRELLGLVSPEIADFSSTLFEDRECHFPPTADDQPAEACDCLLYIDEIQIDPELRGHGIGEEMLHRMSEVIDLEHCIVGLKAFPIASRVGEQPPVADLPKVQRFYERLGFSHAPNNFMYKRASDCFSMRKRHAWHRQARQ